MSGVAITRRRGITAPTLLILLSIVPVASGIFRLVTLATGRVSPDSARFFDNPLPIALHVIAVVPYSLLGALQFAPGFRKTRWHRQAGKVLVPLGLMAALTGLWATLVYPWPAHDGVVLYVTRLIVGLAMTVALVMGVKAIRDRDFAAHGDWMTRAYALGIGAGTQVITHLPWMLTVGMPHGAARAFAMVSAWVINVAVAEYVIRKRRSKAIHHEGPWRAMEKSVLPAGH